MPESPAAVFGMRLVDDDAPVRVVRGAERAEPDHVRREVALVVRAELKVLERREHLLERVDAARRALARDQVELRERLVAVEVEAEEVRRPAGVARVALELLVLRRSSPRARASLKSVAERVDDVARLLHADGACPVTFEVRKNEPPSSDECRELRAARGLEVGAAPRRCRGRSCTRSRPRGPSPGRASPSPITSRRVWQSMQCMPRRVVDVGRRDRVVAQVERAVQALRRRARARRGRRAGRERAARARGR